MTGYIIRRLLQFIPVVIAATLIVYAMVFLIPGDPIRALSGDRPMSPEVQEQIRDQYNLNDPFLLQYAKYMWGVFTQGDFGTTFQGRPVLEIIQQGLPVTLTLAAFAFTFQLVIGGIAGILAAVYKDSFIDRVVQVSLVLVVALPTLAIAFLLQLSFGLNWGLLPIAGTREGLIGYILPAITLAAVTTGIIARMLRSELVEALQSDYVRTATAKGMKRGRVVVRHGLRNSLIPVVTFLGADLATMMGGTVVVETVFNLTGIGGELFRSIQAQENTVVVGVVTLLVLFYVVLNLLVDLLYAAIDPRIRYD